MINYITKTCVLCGESFEVRSAPSIAKKQYCSILCRNRANSQKMRNDPIACKYCGNMFYPSPLRGKLFCSNDCYREHKSFFGTRSKERKALIEYICEQYPTADLDELQKELGISLSAIYNVAHKRGILRSQDAIDKQYEIVSEWMTDNNPMKRPEVTAKVNAYWKANPEKLKANAVKANQVNQRNKPSKLELKCAEYLTALGVEFEHQFIIKDKFVVDFKIGNTILECDGEYWHGHPRFEPLTERQLKQRKRDAARNKYLQACGYTVIRVWESDVTMDNIRAIVEGL